MATGATINLTTSPQQVFNAKTDGGYCTAFKVFNDAASGGKIRVNIPGLHAAGDGFPIPPGESVKFRNALNGIGSVTLWADTTATADYGVVSKL